MGVSWLFLLLSVRASWERSYGKTWIVHGVRSAIQLEDSLFCSEGKVDEAGGPPGLAAGACINRV